MNEKRLYADPTFDAAVRMEANEKKCAVCKRSTELIKGAFRCTVNKQWPKCKGDPKGFLIDGGE